LAARGALLRFNRRGSARIVGRMECGCILRFQRRAGPMGVQRWWRPFSKPHLSIRTLLELLRCAFPRQPFLHDSRCGLHPRFGIRLVHGLGNPLRGRRDVSHACATGPITDRRSRHDTRLGQAPARNGRWACGGCIHRDRLRMQTRTALAPANRNPIGPDPQRRRMGKSFPARRIACDAGTLKRASLCLTGSLWRTNFSLV